MRMQAWKTLSCIMYFSVCVCVCVCVYNHRKHLSQWLRILQFFIYYIEATEEREFLFALYFHCFCILFSDHIQDLMSAESDDEQEGRISPRPLILQSSHQDAITGGKKQQLIHSHLSQIGKRWEGERCHHIRAEVIPNGSIEKCDLVETRKGGSVLVFNSGVRRKDFVAILKAGNCRNFQLDWGKPLVCPEHFVSQETVLCYLAREHRVNMYPIIPSSCFTRAQQDRFCHACSVVLANG